MTQRENKIFTLRHGLFFFYRLRCFHPIIFKEELFVKKLFAILLPLALAASLVMGITAAVNQHNADLGVSLCDWDDKPDLY